MPQMYAEKSLAKPDVFLMFSFSWPLHLRAGGLAGKQHQRFSVGHKKLG